MWQLLRRQPHFRRLFGATLVSEVGNKIHRIALLVLVYEMTSEALWVSLALGVQLLTSVALGPLLSAWADAQERRRLMVLADLLRVPLVIMIPLLGMKSLAALMILIFAVELLRNLHDPVAAAVVPDLVPEADLDNANGLIMFAQRIAEVAFVGLAGLLVALVGAAPAFYIDGATFLLSALIVKGLPQLDPGAGSESAYWARVGEGLRHLVENPPVRRTVLTLAAAAMFGSVEAVLGVVLAVTVLGVGSAGFGVMEAAIALGAVLGTLVIPRLIQRTSRERLFIYGLLAFGLLEASIGLAPHYTWVLIVYLLSGALNMIFIVPARSILQLNTPPALRTRTFSAFGAVMNAAVLFGTIVGGALEGPLGAQMVFVIAGLGVSGVVVVTLVRDRLALVQSPLVSASTLSNESGMD